MDISTRVNKEQVSANERRESCEWDEWRLRGDVMSLKNMI
jgi:hypothetical protein